MRLRRVSTSFFALIIAALSANALLLGLIHESYERVSAAQRHRQASLDTAAQLERETEQLSRLVRAYTVTGEPRYLLYYYDIIAVRNGEKAPPASYEVRTYWDDVIAGRLVHQMPKDGPLRSLSDRMTSQRFGAEEFQLLELVLDATAKLNAIEQVAFAATQGLYNPDTREFVSDGTPRLDFASGLVHGQNYNALQADLVGAVAKLVGQTDRRTAAEVALARERLRISILVSVGFTLIMAMLMVVALRVVSRRVLSPIQELAGVAGVLARGTYSARYGRSAGVEEIDGLGRTFDGMAHAIEDDLAHRTAIQAELEAARKQAEQATHAKSMFLANMSHEIRTPMNAMIGMAYLALRTELTPRQRDYVSKVYNAARSLLGIINDILDFSKVEAGKIELEQIRFRVEDVAANSLALLRQRAQEKDLELLFDLTEPSLLGVDGTLMGDALRLGQIITNLLSNAIKFTEKGHVTLSVGISQRQADRVTLAFTIVDSGIGMTPEQMGRVFQEFTQADGSTTRRYGGSGLGLAISKKLVDLMGGRIGVESTLGGGTTFRVEIPFPLATPPAQPAPPLPRAAAMRVLVVDDEPDARKCLTDLLSALNVGCSPEGSVDAADDGDTALACVETAERDGRPYDLLLIDWVMPRLDGAGLLRALSNRPAVRRPLPIVVSAHDSDVMLDAATQLGAHQLLPKPVLPESLRHLFNWLGGLPSVEVDSSVQHAEQGKIDGMRILLAEDNTINQQLVVDLLEVCGAQVEVAANGQEALECIEAHPPGYYDAVLMDLQMPVVDGYEAARRIRMHPVHFALPVFAVSAHALVEERERCRVLGMNGHISKPIEPEVLYATLAPLNRRRITASDNNAAASASPSMEGQASLVSAADSAMPVTRVVERRPPPDWLGHFRQMLVDCDIDAVDYWQQRSGELSGVAPKQITERIRSALARYDFDAALELLAFVDHGDAPVSGGTGPTSLDER